MSDQFVAEVRIFSFNFAPTGWAFCQGQLLPISQNTALFSLLGTNYGGDGRTNFGLPNLSGASAMHATGYGGSPGSAYPVGATGGTTTHTVIASEMPQHTHTITAEGDRRNAQSTNPQNAVPAYLTGNLLYSKFTTSPKTAMAPSMLGATGGSNPHNNLMPFLVMNYCIALQGIFPPRS